MGCNQKLADGQYWKYCGETDMGQTMPALCTECGGDLKLKKVPIAHVVAAKDPGKGHFYVSLVKSVFRAMGSGAIIGIGVADGGPVIIMVGAAFLIAEILGVVEEMV